MAEKGFKYWSKLDVVEKWTPKLVQTSCGGEKVFFFKWSQPEVAKKPIPNPVQSICGGPISNSINVRDIDTITGPNKKW